jgi:MFS family permease
MRFFDMTENTQITHQQEKRFLHALFFTFGFGVMAWVPRFPELKDSLHLSNGAFGTILTTGSIGCVAALLTIGQIVHNLGLFRVAITSTAVLFLSFLGAIHVHSPVAFMAFNMGIGFGIMAVHVCINTQGFHIQDRSKESVVTSASGYWSSGALITAIVSGLLIGNVDLALHLDFTSIICAVTMITIFIKLRPVLVPAKAHSDVEYSVKDIFTSFHLDWPVSIGMASAIFLEAAVGDWGTIFTKERLNVTSGFSALPYVVFTIFMIFGRLRVHTLFDRYSLHDLARKAALLAGFGFGIPIIVATHLPDSMKSVSYLLFVFGFALGGLGSSFLAPSFTSAANRRSPHPSSVVVGQFGVMNNLLTTILKWLVAGVIAVTGSIALALMIPAALMLVAYFYTKVFEEQ